MEEQVGNKTIDAVFGLLTIVMLVVLPVALAAFGVPPPNHIFWAYWEVMWFLWLIVVLAFLMSRCQLGSDRADGTHGWDSSPQHHPLAAGSGSSFVIPSYCPYCSEPIILDEIHWIQSDEFACHACANVIRVSVKEGG